MIKRILFVVIVVLVGYLYSTYHDREYITDDKILNNWIYTKGIISNDEIYVLEQIDSSLLSGNIYLGWLELSSNSWVPLEDDMWWYSFIVNNNPNDFLFIRSSVSDTWSIENPFTMTCEWPWCPMPWWLNILNMFIHDVKPIKITDMIVVQADKQIILQWTWWSRIEQVKRWP